jgi:hypothetical protein
VALILFGCGGGSAPPPDATPDPQQSGGPQNPPAPTPDPVDDPDPTVPDPGTPVAQLPAGAPAGSFAHVAAGIEGGDFGEGEEQGICLLPSSPRLFMPRLGTDGVVFGTVRLSAFASDDVGVTHMGLMIDGALITEGDGPSLYYDWDTTQYSDGQHTIYWLARDEKYVFRFVMLATVDNTTDYQAPELRFGGFTPYGWHTGTVTVRVEATDMTAVDSLVVTVGNTSYAATEGIGTKKAWVDVDLTADLRTEFFVKARAEDPRGNVVMSPRPGGNSDNHFTIANYVPCYGYVMAPNGRTVSGADVSFPQAHWYHGPGEDEQSKTDVTQSTNAAWWAGSWFQGGFEIGFLDVHQGHTIRFAKNGYVKEQSVSLDVKDDYYWGGTFPTGHLTFDGVSPHARETDKVGVVTGDNDKLEAIVAKLPYLQYSHFDPARLELIDGNNSLDGGEQSFIYVLDNEALLYHYRHLLVNGGFHNVAQITGSPARVQRLRTWVEDGGVLVCSAQAVDLVEALYPERLWLSASSSDGFGTVPEPLGSSETGAAVGLPLLMWNEDDWIREDAWNGGWDNAGSRIPGVKAGWNEVFKFNAEAGVHNWLYVYTATQPQQQRPAVFSFDVGLGTVMYCAMPAYVSSDRQLYLPEQVPVTILRADRAPQD